jgi:hypothetical protein
MPAVNDEAAFKLSFAELMNHLRSYILSDKGKKFEEDEQDTISLLMEINNLCSSKQGAKGMTPLLAVELVS